MSPDLSGCIISILLGECNRPRIVDPRPPLAPIESEIIQQAIWLYLRFTLSFRDVEDLLAERGIMVSYETVRRWVNHFGPMIAADLRKRRPKPHATWQDIWEYVLLCRSNYECSPVLQRCGPDPAQARRR